MTALEVSARDHAGSLLCIKTALSHMESLLGAYGYTAGEPVERAGWTFYALELSPALEDAMRAKFADMMGRYGMAGADKKLALFLSDYFESRGCGASVRIP